MVKRSYTRVIRRAPKKRWASHIETFSLAGANYLAANIYGPSIALVRTLAVTNTDDAIPTPIIVKTSRYEAQLHCQFDLSASQTFDYTKFLASFYIFYVPQGWAIDNGGTPVNATNRYQQIQNLLTSHPEWILCRRVVSDWYQMDNNTAGIFDNRTVIVKSALKRNLNSGDQVMCAVIVRKMTSEEQNYPYSFRCNATITYKTCAN